MDEILDILGVALTILEPLLPNFPTVAPTPEKSYIVPPTPEKSYIVPSTPEKSFMLEYVLVGAFGVLLLILISACICCCCIKGVVTLAKKKSAPISSPTNPC